jgi:hypothetical protein
MDDTKESKRARSEAAIMLGKIGGLVRSGKKQKAVKENLAKATEMRLSYKNEVIRLRARINEMRSVMLDVSERASEADKEKLIVGAGDSA